MKRVTNKRYQISNITGLGMELSAECSHNRCGGTQLKPQHLDKKIRSSRSFLAR